MLYSDLILAALGEVARKAISEMIPQGYQWQSDFARKHRAEGRTEGQIAGKIEGKIEGNAEGKAHAIVMVLEARGIALDAAARERILTCRDLEELDRWVRRAVSATTSHELFA